MLCYGLADLGQTIVVARVVEMKTLHVATEIRSSVKAPAQGGGAFDIELEGIAQELD